METFEILCLVHFRETPGLAEGQLLDYSNLTSVEKHLCQIGLHTVQVLIHEFHLDNCENPL